MKVIDLLNKGRETLFSFELLPPLKGKNIESIYRAIDPLMEFDPKHINITYHQQEVIYKKHKSGLLEKRTVRKRPGTVAISAAIKYKYPKVEVVPHLICGGFSMSETEYALIDLHFLGIKNILALRGDPTRYQKYFEPEPEGHEYAVGLVSQIMNMNQGRYLDEDLENSTSTDFCVGVAGYPEKHFEAPNFATDLRHLKEKVDAGASYIVTQMFFDNSKYFEFVRKCREAGINVPIVPGLKPISRLKDIQQIPQTFHISLPEEFTNELDKCKEDAEVFQCGIEWCIKQSKELKAAGVPALHYFTIGVSENIRVIAKNVF